MKTKYNFIQLVRESKVTKVLVVFVCFSMINQLIFPAVAYALTSGPAQEEFASFEPVETSDMVDVYSGDFTYNLPLLSVPGPNGGYPINLAYHSGIGMEQEASWVGLGWNVNVGAINRQLIGLPDDFDGDIVDQQMHLKKDWTIGFSVPRPQIREIFGFEADNSKGPGYQIYYNSYRGLGYNVSYSVPIFKTGGLASASCNIGLSFDSQSGIDVSPQLGLNGQLARTGAALNFGFGINSRRGFQGFSFSAGLSYSKSISTGYTGENKATYGFANVTGRYTSTISFNPDFAVPSASIPMNNHRFDLDLKIGKMDGLGVFNYGPANGWQAFYEQSKVANGGKTSTAAYGYLNLHNATPGDHFMDFSRDPQVINDDVPNLPVSSATYDIYQVSGQGTGGMFRPYRNEVGIFADRTNTTKIRGKRFNLEGGGKPGAPPKFHVGLGYTNRRGDIHSGTWTDNNNLALAFAGPTDGEVYEPYYFLMHGEKSAVYKDEGANTYNEDQLAGWEGEEPLRVDLSTTGTWLKRKFAADNEFVSSTSSASMNSTDIAAWDKMDNRHRRASNIIKLTHAEAKEYGFTKNYQYTVSGNTVNKFPTSNSPYDGIEHHISEIQTLTPDGMRYIYGLPAYNHMHEEVSFSAKGENVDADNRYVEIPNANDPDADHYSTTGNQYYSRRSTPPYVHSWMLTAVVSADYVDRTNDGITDDDYGYWVVFNYEKKSSDYQWRTPYRDANYVEGLKDFDNDDIGSYSYGKKDIFYLESIQTKTHTAVFETSARKDGLSTSGEYATGTGQPDIANPPDILNFEDDEQMFKLDAIHLYTNAEYANQNPVPLKSTFFTYTYDLVKNVYNNANFDNTYPGTLPSDNGKLTLTEVYFTYNGGYKGELNKYKFDYGTINDDDENPYYDLNNMDRWGNFKRNEADNSNGSGANWDPLYYPDYPFQDFPYTLQADDYDNDGDVDQTDTDLRNTHASAWHLRSIELPTGGTIEIDYEADDYAYVEDQKAMQMFDIRALGATNLSTKLDNSTGSSDRNHTVVTGSLFEQDANGNYRVYLELPTALSAGTAGSTADERAEYFEEHYLKGMNKLYYEAYMHLKTDPNNGGAWVKDYVKGHANLVLPTTTCLDLGTCFRTDFYGLVEHPSISGSYTAAYITLSGARLRSINLTGREVHPFARAGYNYIRVQRPDILNAGANDHGTPLQKTTNFIRATLNMIEETFQMMSGYENYAYVQGFCPYIDLNGRSVVRLYNPNGKKYGGGSRVKSLVLNDNWSTMKASGTDSKYGKVYDYTIQEDGQTISSGVAYEPAIGSAESALKQPIDYVESNFLKTDQNLFLETPIGERYYPGQSVGYRQVTVKSYSSTLTTNAPSERNLAPYEVYEFYTPKDFPVVVKQTDMSADPKVRRFFWIPAIYQTSRVRQARSQGYTIILNDMPGKQKAFTIKTAPTAANLNGTIKYKEEYHYNTKQPYQVHSKNELDNEVMAVRYDETSGNVQYLPAVMGQTHDIFVDMHEDMSFEKTRGLDLNLEGVCLPCIFLPVIPVPIPNFSDNHRSMKSVVTHKVIYRTGILNEVVKTDESSTVTTQHLAYDHTTGAPMLSRSDNEFGDQIHSINYPAHWYYDGMAEAFRNIGFTMDGSDVGDVISGSTFNNPGKIGTSGKLFMHNNDEDNFTVGDELWINTDATDFQAWIYEIGTDYIQCLDEDGEFITSSNTIQDIKIIRSGRRNLLSPSVGSIVFKGDAAFENFESPSSFPATIAIDEADGVMDASAIEFKDSWQMFCSAGEEFSESSAPPICQYSPDVINFVAMLNELIYEPLLLETVEHIDKLDWNRNAILSNFPFINSSDWGSGCQAVLTSDACAIADGISPPEFDLSFFATGQNCESDFNCDAKIKFIVPNGVSAYPSFCDIFKITLVTPLDYYSTAGSYNIVKVTALMDDGSTELIEIDFGSSPCFSVIECEATGYPTVSCTSSDNVNPFLNSLMGVWRPWKAYAYQATRDYETNTDDNEPDIRTDGIYTEFTEFDWTTPANNDDDLWVLSNTITKYSPFGFELENQDALDNYSAAIYGYNHSLVTAVGANSRFNELAFDGFEDYNSPYTVETGECGDGHSDWKNQTSPNVSTNEAHTGIYSFKVGAASSEVLLRDILDLSCDNYVFDPSDASATDANGFTPVGCQCVGKFSPVETEEYFVSAWVKLKHATVDNYIRAAQYSQGVIDVNFVNTSNVAVGNPVRLSPDGNIIEGWMRISGKFTVPSGAAHVYVELKNLNASGSSMDAYFDDFRIHPFNGNMNSYVYHPTTLRLMAELDNNNYATFYVYDEEGALTKIKKETYDGIKTIKESRSHAVDNL